MEVKAFQYVEDKGWSVDRFPELDSEQSLIIVFAAPDFYNNPAPIKELASFYKKAKMIGCSTAGEIFGPSIFDKSLSVVIIQFEKTPIKIAKAEVKNNQESFEAGKHIAEQLMRDDLQSIFVLSDGLKVNGSDLVKGLNSQGKGMLISGGLAGDSSAFKNTWTIFNGEIITDHIVAVGFYGEHITIAHASKGGWDIFGPARHITRSEQNILYELDNQPALSLYKEYLGDRAAELPASGLLFPLAIWDNSEKDATPVVRTILGIDEKENALIFAGDMPVGHYAQLMRANFDHLINSASEAGEMAKNSVFEQQPTDKDHVVTISISCVGRRLLLGERTEEETESTFEAFPNGTTQVGFYSYGELSPLASGECRLHNQTMTLTTFMEK